MSNQDQFLTDDLYLSVDGGATSCKVALYNFSGEVLGVGKSGASNARLGAKRVLNEIMEATHKAFADANIDVSNINQTHACFGLAGLELARDQAHFNALETDFKSVILETDGVTACLGAFNGQDGAIVITGTGTSALAMNEGCVHNIGGWGFEISDTGSGAILGRNAVRYALRAAETLETETKLTDYILDYFKHDMSKMVLWAEKAEPKDFAYFAAHIFEFNKKGDAAAKILIDNHVTELVQLIDGIMAFGAAQFTLLGGLAAPSIPLLPDRLKKQYVASQNEALFGGFLRIQKSLSGSRVQIKQKFKNIQEGKPYVKNG